MAHWAEFATASPDLATAGSRLFGATGIVFLASLRRDGAPRLHPVVPIFADGGLYIAIAGDSPKRHDLRRDNRYALHASLGPDDEEFALDGTTDEITDPAVRAAVVASADHAIRPADVVFELGLSRSLHTVWERVGQPDTRAIRQRWIA